MKKSSSNKEDYLKAIYENNGIDEFVSNKTLATHLGFSPASVTEMVEKLQNDGLIDYKPYTGVKLTEAGINITAGIIRNHRIVETFLYDKLDYSLHDLHNLSEELEHVKDPVFFARLYDEVFIEKAVKPIAQFKQGESPEVRRVMDDTSILNYMSTIDLNIGDTIHITEVDDFNELMLFTINDKTDTHHISFKQAQIIFSY
jgi:DtxR family Mn-dependent transcriptional regulator